MLAGRGEASPMAALLALPLALQPFVVQAAASTGKASSTCGSLKHVYKQAECCRNPTKSSNFQVVPVPDKKLFNNNICAGKKPIDSGAAGGEGYFNNVKCTLETGVLNALEQAGANVTKGYVGGIDAVGGNRT